MVRRSRMIDGMGNELTLRSGGPHIFVSAETTATGAANQEVAHTLGRIPAAVIVVITELPVGLAGAVDVAYGTHTALNCLVTITNTAKFKILALA